MGYHPAVRYLCLRLGHGLLVLAGVSVLTFALAELAPGSMFDEARIDPRISAETVAAMRDRYGLDRSLPDKYFHWLQSIPRGDLGFSVAYDRPVGPLLWPRARNTLLLDRAGNRAGLVHRRPGRRLGGQPTGRTGRPRGGGGDHCVAQRAGPASRLEPSAAGRAHRLFSDRRNDLRRLCRTRPLGESERRRLTLLLAGRGVDPHQPSGAGQACSRQPDRRPRCAVHSGGPGGGYPRAAPAPSPRACVPPRTP